MESSKNFVAIGHVDTGKSTLCGHLLYKSNYINDHDFTKIKEQAKKDKMEKWIWARILDIYEEEMSRGKTHEFNEISFNYNNKLYKMIDTPGHQGFIRSMISGISRDIDIGVLLVSVIDNEFQSSFDKGMLKEHLILSKAIGIKNLIVLINKMDLINWDQDKYNEKKKIIDEFLTYINWDNKFFIPISAFSGIGLVDKIDLPNWYNGNSFIDCLDNIEEKIDRFDENEKFLSSKIVIRLNVINSLDSIISPGYSCIIHIDSNEYPITFKHILNDKKFIKSNMKSKCIIEFSEKILVSENMKFILRKDDFTIGFGKVFKIAINK